MGEIADPKRSPDLPGPTERAAQPVNEEGEDNGRQPVMGWTTMWKGDIDKVEDDTDQPAKEGERSG